MDWKGMHMEHVRTLHEPANGERGTFRNSALVEGLWGRMRQRMRHIYYSFQGGSQFEDYIYETLWRL